LRAVLELLIKALLAEQAHQTLEVGIMVALVVVVVLEPSEQTLLVNMVELVVLGFHLT
jgi:hypothetical protein